MKRIIKLLSIAAFLLISVITYGQGIVTTYKNSTFSPDGLTWSIDVWMAKDMVTYPTPGEFTGMNIRYDFDFADPATIAESVVFNRNMSPQYVSSASASPTAPPGSIPFGKAMQFALSNDIAITTPLPSDETSVYIGTITVTFNNPVEASTMTVLPRNNVNSPVAGAGSFFAHPGNPGIRIPFSDVAEVPLPIKLLKFTAEVLNKKAALLNWTTATEINSKGFEVQRSTDGTTWANVVFIKSKAENGNSSANIEYEFIDSKPASGLNIYRLKQVDLTEKFEYSVPKIVNISSNHSINTFPNPVQNTLYVGGLSGSNKIIITNIVGQIVMSKESNDESVSELNVSNLTKGSYFVIVTAENGVSHSFAIVKN